MSTNGNNKRTTTVRSPRADPVDDRELEQRASAPLLGKRAPDFELPSAPNESFALSSILGRPVVLVFSPAHTDFEPKGAIPRTYSSYREGEGVSERALFVLDQDGVVFWSEIAPITVNPGAGGILNALDRLPERMPR